MSPTMELPLLRKLLVSDQIEEKGNNAALLRGLVDAAANRCNANCKDQQMECNNRWREEQIVTRLKLSTYTTNYSLCFFTSSKVLMLHFRSDYMLSMRPYVTLFYPISQHPPTRALACVLCIPFIWLACMKDIFVRCDFLRFSGDCARSTQTN
jgi:hypothetical protein